MPTLVSSIATSSLNIKNTRSSSLNVFTKSASKIINLFFYEIKIIEYLICPESSGFYNNLKLSFDNEKTKYFINYSLQGYY